MHDAPLNRKKHKSGKENIIRLIKELEMLYGTEPKENLSEKIDEVLWDLKRTLA